MSRNTLKVRDDREPLVFYAENDGLTFRLDGNIAVDWAEREFGFKELRRRIEPWLTSLFQAEHLSVLIGSGLTNAVHHLATGKLATGMDAKIQWAVFNDEIQAAAKTIAQESGRKYGNIEDQIRTANELLRGLEILKNVEHADMLRNQLQEVMEEFSNSILADEERIATADVKEREQAFNVLVTFLMSFCSRTGTRERLNLFTTNYDRLIEVGAELAGIHLLDRFIGTLTPIFRSSRLDVDMHYNPPGIRGEPRYLEGVARFAKLHGSVDWVQVGSDIRRIGIPFGAQVIKPYLNAPGLHGASAHQLMIYPNAAKDRETAEHPYVELFRDFAAAICRPNSTLVTYGYGFGDEHINRVIRDMLTIPSTHLVVISFSDPIGRIMSIYEELGRHAQISLLIGPVLGDLQHLTDHFLPKPAIDKSMSRMAFLLQQRLGLEDNNSTALSESDDYREVDASKGGDQK